MSKSWETLFHLSSFMKYLLQEVLPKEKTSCPHYVLESLFDLQRSTHKCIGIIQGVNPVDPELVNHNEKLNITSNLVHDLAPSKHSDEINQITLENLLRRKHLKDITKKETAYKTDPVSRSDVHDYINSENLGKNIEKTSVDSNSLCEPLQNDTLTVALTDKFGSVCYRNSVISKNFLYINEQVLNGFQSLGLFCLTCDKCFFSISDWSSHSTDDWVHLDKIEKTSNREISCESCKFFIFGDIALIDIYMDFHLQSHSFLKSTAKFKKVNEEENESGKIADPEQGKRISNDTTHSVPSLPIYQSDEPTSFSRSSSRTSNSYASLLSNFGNNIYPTTEDESKKLKKNEAEFTNEKVGPGPETNNSTHSVLSSPVYQSEDSTSLSRSPSRTLYCQESKISYLENNNCLTVGNGTKKFKSEAEFKTEKNERQIYKIFHKFIELDKMIHEKKLNEAYYCRPCDEYCFSKSHWIDHSKKEFHISFMTDLKFKNFEAICNYCNLRFFGTESAIFNYFKFHAVGHSKAPSYSFIEWDDKNKGDKNFNQVQRRPDCSHQSEKSSDQSAFKSKNKWSKNEEDRVLNMKELHLMRKREKNAGKPCSFGGYCLNCETIILDGFDWIDHFELPDHLSRVSQGDEEIVFSEFNLRVFGNKSFIQGILH